MINKGKLVAVSISTIKGVPKENVSSAELLINHGILNDAHAGDWHRQVSLLAVESIEKMKQKGLEHLTPGIFAENLTTEFIDIPNLQIGTHLKIGNSAIIEITQIGKECHTRCAIYNTAGDCVMPKEGIFAKVISGGTIAPDDIVEIM